MKISIIAAIGKNNEIGKNNSLLWHMPNDLKHFKEITSGKTIIMGRKTFESIGRPLPNRRNIIITRDANYSKNLPLEQIEIAHSLDEALEKANLGAELPSEVFVIGGAEIYRQMIEKAEKLYITQIEAEDKDADSFFPIINKTKWKEIKREKFSSDEKNKFDYTFVEYEKI
jgi:dihydrofolate reductase